MRKTVVMLVVLFCSTCSVFAQTSIKGKVTDSKDGSPVSGATVRVKGERTSVTTKSDGTFEIVSKSGMTLDVTEIGHISQSVRYSGSGNLEILLVQDLKALSEVVVTGVGVATSKRKLAISVESISADKLPATPSASIDQALVGKIAGATISSASGSPGANVSILLRGINTLQGGTSPLILVDGVQMSSTTLQSLDLNTVDRVEVVQGAASATIYGAQGANGVIQIFTKRGKPGPVKIDVSSRISFDQPLNIGKLHQPFNHSFETDASGIVLNTNGVPLKPDPYNQWDETLWLNGTTGSPFDANNKPYKGNLKYYDHIKQLFNNVKTINNSIVFSGAKDKFDFAVSGSTLTQESVIYGKLNRTNFTTNLGFEAFKNFKIRFINQLIYSKSTLGTEAISSAVFTYPFVDFKYKDADGNSSLKFGGAGANARNPFYYYQYERPNVITVDVLPSINANYKVNRFVELDYKFGINYSRTDNEYYVRNQEKNVSSVNNNSYIGGSIKGSINQNLSRNVNFNSLATATMIVDFAKDLKLNIPIVSTTQGAFDWRKRNNHSYFLNFVGLPVYEPVNGAQADIKTSDEFVREFATYGFYVNQRFEFADIGGISAGFRDDYASTFGAGSKPFFFPRGDVYLRISKFGFWNSLNKVIPEFKLRAAYGEAGIQPGDFDRIITLRKGSFDNGSWLALKAQANNPALNVEVSKELEIGTDVLFTPGRNNVFTSVKLSATYWQRKGNNVIYNQDLALSTGVGNILTNAFDLSSKGFQFSLDANVYNSKNFNWNSTTFGHQVSKLDRIANGKDVILPFGSINYVLKEGQRLGTVYGYRAITSLDMADATGKLYIPKETWGNYEVVNGIVTDTASKKVQFTPDKVAIGNTDPKFTFSFSNSFSYKDFLTFSFQLDWNYGAKRYNQTKEWMYSEGLHGDYDKAVTINKVTLPFSGYYKSFYDAAESNGTKDYFFENANFLRLRNVAIAYDFVKVFKVHGLNRLQLFVSGRNLWTQTKYTGMDPEATSSGTENSSIQRGADQFAYPNIKSYQIGLNVGF
jgi:TonB-linked SusC/RagA family outer membrane protein